MYDAIIVGSGPAGLSAALNLKIHNKTFLWFGSKTLSDKVMKAQSIRNYPGFTDISGEHLYQKFQEQMDSLDIAITEKTVTNIMKNGDSFMVLADNEIYEAKTLLLSMGVMNAKLMEGEEELLGRGVSYCATCDGAFYKGKKIAVICNAKKYEHEVEFLAELAGEVIYFPQYTGCEIAMDHVEISKEVPVAIEGNLRAEHLVLKGGQKIDIDGIFILRNAIAPTTLFKGIAVEDNHIAVNRQMETNIKGCFAAGDCTGRPYQYTKAVGEGNVAAHGIITYLAGGGQDGTNEK